jgi:hypothetical protein
VKTVENKIRKCLALLLMMIYLVVLLSNLFFLPKYGKYPAGNQNATITSISARAVRLFNGGHNSSILFHRTSKTIIENRQNLSVFFKAAAAVFLLMLLGTVGRLALSKRDDYAPMLFLRRREHAYLNFCSLRI